MVQITFYGGVGEIGGNKVLVEDDGARVFLDFGLPFGRRAEFFEEFLRPRVANGIGDFLATGLVPDLKGIYRKGLVRHQGREPAETKIDAVFLSHGHADHCNYVSFLRRDIPVYCGKTCLRILEAVEEQSQRDIESEVLNFKPRPLFRKDYRKKPVERKFETFRTGDSVKVGDLEVEPVHVDHSVPGAYGFIVRTSEGPLVYTGDLRLHGAKKELTEEFVRKAGEVGPEAMVSEGTRIDKEKTDESEEKVYRKTKKDIEGFSGPVVVDFNFKDVDRFKTFYRLAEETGRKLVISFKHACFLEKYHRDEKLEVPDSKDENIRLLKPKRRTGTYTDGEDYTDKYIKSRLDYPNIIKAEDIRENPSEYMVVLNYWYFNNLVDLKPRGGLYIHSLSEPFNEEMEISHQRMLNWLNKFKMKYRQRHCSGHASGPEIKELIEKVSPKKVFPIHTEHPEMFRGLKPKTVRVEEGKNYDF